MAIYNSIKIDCDSKLAKRGAVDLQTEKPAEFWIFNNLKFEITLLSNGELFSDFANVAKLVLGIKQCDNGGYPLDTDTFEILKEIEAASINTTLTDEQRTSGSVHATFAIKAADIAATMKSGLKWLVVQAVDSDGGQLTFFGGNIICKNDASNGTASGETLTRFQSFQTACETAKADAETAANNAEQSAGLASDFAQAAEQQKNLAQGYKDAAALYVSDCAGYKNDAEAAKTSAEEAASNAIAYSDSASVYAFNAEQSANLAQEVSRIAIVPITATTQTIQPNKCYTLNANGGSYTLTPKAITGDLTHLLQAMIQIKTGTVAPTITWAGITHFFNNKIPTINANSSYNVIYEFDNLLLDWVVGVIKK